jgi:hypothetical protein
MNLLQSPGDTMQLIMIATVGGTALLAATEAKKHGMQTNKEAGTYSPTAWFFILIFIWVIGYPVYLYKRKHYGLKNHLIAGLLVMLVFCIAWFGMTYAIEDRKAEVRAHLNSFKSLTQ